MAKTNIVLLLFIGAFLFVFSFAVFTVDEREKVVKFQLGEVVKTDYEPGIYLMTPFFNNVLKYDSRIQTLDAAPERYLTSEKKNVIVDSFVKWRIADIRKFYTATRGDIARANIRLAQIIKDGLRGEFGKRTIQEVVSGERTEIMDILTEKANGDVEEFGIKIVDVRIKRIDLAKEISNSVYQRMQAERLRVAKDLRARGEEEAEKIRAEADRQRTIILAEAYRDAEILRGEGDATAANIYATAYNKDKEFYGLYRTLNAYKSTFNSKSDIMVLEPNSEFFKYFK